MKKGFSLLRCVIALMLGALGVIIGIYYTPLLPVLAAVIGFTGAAWGGYYSALSLSMACTGIGFIYFSADAVTTITWIAQLIIVAVVICAGFTRLASYRHMAIIIAAISAVSLYIQLCLPSLLSGEAPSAGVVAQMQAYYEAFAQLGIIENPSIYIQTISTMFFGCIIMMSEFIGFVCVLAAYALFKLAKCEIRPMSRFSSWRLPKSLTIGTILIAVVCIVLNLLNYSAADQLNAAVLGLLLPLFGVQGFCVLAFFFLRRTRKLPAKLLFFIFAGLLSMFLPYTVAAVGIMEQLMHIRKRTVMAEAHMRLIIEARNKQIENEIRQAEHENEKRRFGEDAAPDAGESAPEAQTKTEVAGESSDDNETNRPDE